MLIRQGPKKKCQAEEEAVVLGHDVNVVQAHPGAGPSECVRWNYCELWGQIVVSLGLQETKHLVSPGSTLMESNKVERGEELDSGRERGLLTPAGATAYKLAPRLFKYPSWFLEAHPPLLLQAALSTEEASERVST